MGRPRIEIDYAILENLCEIQCTKEEIAHAFDIDDSTLTVRIKEKYDCTFPEYYKRHSSTGKISLRRLQYKSAVKGNVTMQIWLGKNWLGQRDTAPDEDVSEKLDKLVAAMMASAKNS